MERRRDRETERQSGIRRHLSLSKPILNIVPPSPRPSLSLSLRLFFPLLLQN
jgi:hypothetical protein